MNRVQSFVLIFILVFAAKVEHYHGNLLSQNRIRYLFFDDLLLIIICYKYKYFLIRNNQFIIVNNKKYFCFYII